MNLLLKVINIKMWAEFNYSGYPIVEVNMKGVIKDDAEFESFLKEWRNLYEQRDFVFIFDTRNVGFVNIKYAFRMANFIKELKTREYQNLKYNVIITGNWWTRMLLKLIFKLQTPVAPVEYHTNPNTIDLEKLLNKANEGCLKVNLM